MVIGQTSSTQSLHHLWLPCTALGEERMLPSCMVQIHFCRIRPTRWTTPQSDAILCMDRGDILTKIGSGNLAARGTKRGFRKGNTLLRITHTLLPEPLRYPLAAARRRSRRSLSSLVWLVLSAFWVCSSILQHNPRCDLESYNTNWRVRICTHGMIVQYKSTTLQRLMNRRPGLEVQRPFSKVFHTVHWVSSCIGIEGNGDPHPNAAWAMTFIVIVWTMSSISKYCPSALDCQPISSTKSFEQFSMISI